MFDFIVPLAIGSMAGCPSGLKGVTFKPSCADALVGSNPTPANSSKMNFYTQSYINF